MTDRARIPRLEGVDVLRGLAIFFVLMNHVNIRLLIAKVPYGHAIPRQLLGALVWNGQNGVQIFFAISGFLITSTSLRRWGSLSKIRVWEFYRLRFARIAPLLLLLLAILSALHFTGSKWFVVTPKTGGLGRALLAALTFHVNVLEANRGYLPPNWDILWSLAVEEVFYFFFPLACRLLGRGRWLYVLLAGFVVMGPVARTVLSRHNEVWREYSYLGGMDAIALGCLTALLLPNLVLSRGRLVALRSAGILVMFFVLGFAVPARRMGLEGAGLDMTILAVATCAVIRSAAHARTVRTVFRPLVWIGQRSYEIYLTHMFVVIALFSVFVSMGKSPPLVPALFVTATIFAAILGELTARYYSEPMNRYLRRR